ncbi:hypothetical protein CD351_08120 [Erythrobacter sp. KY5]|uniref:efflux transporter outer membrane subunit n=1 Tax=Erythrobacter sp. KY5 TaxID=2011159 RepID=UPI000DBF28A8|nr:efflux transporter outer membrane subunit [Erythrobacter sp. KY5]AWW74389.1 hypothetical protein CD351_08120 [Erythrobacter sp. KY5]
MYRAPFSCLSAFLLASCAGSEPVVLTSPPEKFVSANANGGDVAIPQWLEALEDPFLDTLVERALADNLEIDQASARVEQARAGARLTRTALLPRTDLRAGMSRDRISEATAGLGALAGDENSGINFPNPADTFDVGGDLIWELDLFGANKKALRVARAELVAVRADRQASELRIAAEVARTYFEARRAEALIAISKQQLSARRRIIDITTAKVRFGDALPETLLQERRALADLESDAQVHQADLAAAQFALAVLLALEPVELLALWKDSESTDPRMLYLPSPGEVLSARPDIVAAEYRLRAANGQVDVEIAEYYPKIQLGASIGSQAEDPGDLLTQRSQTFSIGPSLNWRILDFGAIDAAVAQARGAEKEAYADYRLAMLRAIEEIEREVSRFGALSDVLVSRTQIAELKRAEVAIARAKYEFGDIERLALLREELEFQNQEMQEAIARADLFISYSVLAKALGGAQTLSSPG